jgi:activator of 2-hydroxyglutaryl-CoA dehydratase
MNYIGIDIGSVSVKIVLIQKDASLKVLSEQYIRHHGQVSRFLIEGIESVLHVHPPESIAGIAVTGNGGERISKALNAYYVNEVIAQARSAAHLYPHIKTIIEIGGEDAKANPDGGRCAEQGNTFAGFCHEYRVRSRNGFFS